MADSDRASRTFVVADAHKVQALRALNDAFCQHIYSTALQYLQHSFDTDVLDLQFRDILAQDDWDVAFDSACNVAFQCSNASKNRYVDIVPYDSNRVELPSLSGSLSALASSSTINYSLESQLSRSVGSWDLIGRRNSLVSSNSSRQSCTMTSDDTYINASFLKDPVAPRSSKVEPTTYIATQGPLPNTVTDFWRMIISADVSAVVMLTELTMQTIGTGATRAQCAAYFPERQGDCLRLPEGITVTCVHRSQLSDCLLFRQLEIVYPADLRTQQHSTLPQRVSAAQSPLPPRTQQSQQKTLWVNHYKLAGWPDSGVPADTLSVRALSLALDSCRRSGSRIVAHCSAGVGRTGTFIALDILLQRLHRLTLQKYGSVSDSDITAAMNIQELVRGLRKQRRGTVQTGKQYAFIWRALIDELNLLLRQYR